MIAETLGVTADEVELSRTANAKPAISRPATNLTYSVAHAPSITLVALAAGFEVGVDVEPVNRDVSEWALWRHVLTDAEASRVAIGSRSRNEDLLQIWVRKEAFLKAAGTGLATDPREIVTAADGSLVSIPTSLGHPREWSVSDVRLPGHVAAVACRCAKLSVVVDGADGLAMPITGTVADAAQATRHPSPIRR